MNLRRWSNGNLDILVSFRMLCAGYCLSGMLGYGTREDLEREAESLRRENARLMRSNLTLQEEIELMEKEAKFREKTKV